MDKLKAIIEGLLRGDKIKPLARSIGISKNTIKTYRNILEKLIVSNPHLKHDLAGIMLLFKDMRNKEKSTNFKWLQANKELINQLFTKCNNLIVIHEKLASVGYDGSYSSLNRYLNKVKRQNEPPIVRMETLPGEYAQVDFGFVGKIFDPDTGNKVKAYVFVMTLCYSRLAYYEIVKAQNIENWISCHVHAFEFFGGVPKIIIPDNLKAAIIKASFCDPKLNRTYRELALHYGFQIDPCIPATPEHKGKVESGVKYVKNNFLPLRQFKDFTDANQQLAQWNTSKASVRYHGTTKRKPIHLFNLYEKKHLGVVTPQRFEISCWKRLKLHNDIHVNFDNSYYSSPYEYKGQYVWCRGTKDKIEIFLEDNEIIAVHRRVKKGQRSTNFKHYPPNKIEYMKYDTDYCKSEARLIGENTYRIIKALLDEEPIRNLRGAQNIIWLTKKYQHSRVEQACRRALYFGNYTYRGIKNILEKGLDHEGSLFAKMEKSNSSLDESYTRNLQSYFRKEEVCKQLPN